MPHSFVRIRFYLSYAFAVVATLVLLLLTFGEASAEDVSGLELPAACIDQAPSYDAEESYQHAIQFVAQEEYAKGFRCFQLAVQGGNILWRTGHWGAFSRQPEWWFNAGLAGSHVAGRELESLAAFEVYLRLAPSAASSAAVIQQMSRLVDAERETLLRSLVALETVAMRRIAETSERDWLHDYHRSAASWNLVRSWLYLGDRGRAEQLLIQIYGADWQINIADSFTGGSDVFLGDEEWAPLFQGQSIRDDLEMKLELGDINAADRFAPTLPSSELWPNGAWICSALRVGDSIAAEQAMRAWHSRIVGSTREELAHLDPVTAVALFASNGHGDWAADVVRSVEFASAGVSPWWLPEVVGIADGSRPADYCEMRPVHELLTIATNPELLSRQLVTESARRRSDLGGDGLDEALEILNLRARDLWRVQRLMEARQSRSE